jgi:hypothetical protein
MIQESEEGERERLYFTEGSLTFSGFEGSQPELALHSSTCRLVRSKALGSEEGKMIGSGLCHEQNKVFEHGHYCA